MRVHAGIDTLALILFRMASIHLCCFTFPLKSLSTLDPAPTLDSFLTLWKGELIKVYTTAHSAEENQNSGKFKSFPKN